MEKLVVNWLWIPSVILFIFTLLMIIFTTLRLGYIEGRLSMGAGDGYRRRLGRTRQVLIWIFLAEIVICIFLFVCFLQLLFRPF